MLVTAFDRIFFRPSLVLKDEKMCDSCTEEVAGNFTCWGVRRGCVVEVVDAHKLDDRVVQTF